MGIPISIDLELNNALTGLKSLEAEILKATRGLQKPLMIDAKGNAVDVIGNINRAVEKSISQTRTYQNELRQALASLIASGKQGTAEYRALESELKKTIAETQKFDKALEEVDKQINGLGQKESIFQRLGGSIKNMVTVAGGNLLSAGISKGFGMLTGSITGLVGSMIRGNAEMESYRASIDVMLGSAEAGAKKMEELKKFAASTPFEFPQLASATQTMLGFGISADKTTGYLKMLGDISGGNAERLSGLALVFSQVAASGKLQGQDLMQMINQGFNPLNEISKKTGKSMGELKKEMEAGKISFDMVVEAMQSATSEGGTFYGMMEKQSKSFSGLVSTLQDNLNELIRGIGQPLFDAVKLVTDGLIKIINDPKVQEALNLLVGSVSKALTPLIPIISQIVGQVAPLLATAVTNIVPLIEGLAPVITNILNTLVPMITGLFGQFIPLISGVMIALTPLIDAIMNLVSKVLPLLMQLLTPLMPILTPLVNILVMVLVPILNILTPILQILLTALNGILKPIMWLIEIVVKAVEFALKPLQRIINIVIKVVTLLTEKLISTNKKASETNPIIKELSKVFKFIGETVEWFNKHIDKTIGKIEEAANGVLRFLGILPEEKKVKVKVSGMTEEEFEAGKKRYEEMLAKAEPQKKKKEGGGSGSAEGDKAKTRLEKLKEAYDKLYKSAEKELFKKGVVKPETLEKLRELNDKIKEAEKQISEFKETIEKKIVLNITVSKAFEDVKKEGEEAAKAVGEKLREEFLIKNLVTKRGGAVNQEELSKELKKLREEGKNTSEYISQKFREELKPINILPDYKYRYEKSLEELEKYQKERAEKYKEMSYNEKTQLNDTALMVEKWNDSIAEVLGINAERFREWAEGVGRSLNMAKSFFAEHTVAYKAFAVVENIVATYLAATKALATNPDPITKWVEFGLIIATGLANQAKILGAEKGHLPNEPFGKKGATDTQLIWVNPAEAIIPADVSQRERPLIEHLIKGGRAEDFLIKNYKIGIMNDNTAIDYLKSIDRKLDNATLVKSERQINLKQEKLIIKNYIKPEYWR